MLSANRSVSCDTWRSGLNNNVLVLGSSGGGKTRNHVKPNLLQCQGSYIVLDCKGSLYHEMGPYLEENGYIVDCIDFNAMDGTIGYNPLDHIRWCEGRPMQQDIISIASAICPVDEHASDSFWPLAAANYLTAYIAYVLEALPDEAQNMSSVIRMFELAVARAVDPLFTDLQKEDPGAYAPSLYNRAKATCGAEKMHASILGILAADLVPFGFEGVIRSYSNPRQIDFRSFGREKRALFVTIDDMDTSLRPLTSLFIRQAFSSLCDAADHGSPDGRLAVPVRLMLDDFANLNVANFDNILSVTRSREISCTIVCQTVSQLEARYGKPAANSIIGNCDHQLVLGFQDEATARYFSLRANKPAASLLATPTDRWWLFQRGHAAVCDKAYQLEQHPRYADLAACGQAEPGADLTEMWLDDIDQEFFDFEELGPEDLELFGDANAA